MKKELFINVDKKTNYTDIKRKVGMLLFEFEKNDKITNYSEIVIKIGVEK